MGLLTTGDNMRDYLGGMTRDELERLALRLIDQGPEGLKIDFKRIVNLGTAAEKAEFAKDVSSIANADDESHLDDYGFIIVGAERGTVLGGATDFAHDKVDSYQARLTDVLREWLAPVPSFSLVAFQEPTKGPWGVIVIPPSTRQPHIMIRDAGDVAKHEWWVRINDTKGRAGALDYARILSKTASRAVRPLEFELQRLAVRMDLVEQGGVGLKDIATLLRSAPSEALQGSDAHTTAVSPAQQLRRHLMTPVHVAEDILVGEALRIAQVMNDESPENPWVFASTTPASMLDAIEYLERESQPLAEAMAVIAKYDDASSLTGPVIAAFEILAREPQPPHSGPHWVHATSLRLYPVALCLYTLALVGTQKRRGSLLRAVLSVRFVDRNSNEFPMLHAIRCLRTVNEVFKLALRQQYFEPIAERLSIVIPGWCAGLVPVHSGLTAFLQAEFVLGLAYLEVSRAIQNEAFPFPGKYFYAYEARRAIEGFLRKQPSWLKEVYGRSVEEVLKEFDLTAATVVDRQSFGSGGFVNGAAHAWASGKTA